MQSRLGTEPQSASTESIAIVGVGCRLPGNVQSVEDLFAVLNEGRDCISEIPMDRWDVDAYHDPDPMTPGKTYVRHGGFISDIRRFDAAFFGISDAEASRMDPQQRILLETVWHALEDAGQASEELSKSNTGVFLAMMNTNNYWTLKTNSEGLAGTSAYDAMGDATSIAAGRISHFLDLEGPCLTLDTACSGSLVALHLARQSILTGECDAAIVAGVSAILTPYVHVSFSKIGLMSRSGRCRAFDADADGYTRGEGCVAVLLRRQSTAVARGDRILASVVGSAVNHDGRTPAITAPNGRTQERVARKALASIGMHPNEVGYVEAHGTGTPIGDPIEMAALVNVYGADRSEREPLYVRSSKSNFGHIEAGAGLLGVVTAALSLDRERIFPNVHFKKLNSNIDLAGVPVRIPDAAFPWPRGETPRVVGINSFGYSGTNAHAIVRETPAPVAPQSEAAGPRPCELLVLSAKSPAGLKELADRWLEFLEQDEAPGLPQVAFTAAVGRTHFRHRLAIVVRDKDEAIEKLSLWREGRVPKAVAVGNATALNRPKIAFVFTGQGSQYAGMGRQLYEAQPRFKASIDQCADFMDADLGVPLLDVLFGPESAALLGNTRYVQPTLFAIEYALADLLRHFGVEPDYLIGHSVGEIVAACVSGMLSLEDAARLAVGRGQLMGGLPSGGKMLALDTTEAEARAWIAGLEDEVSIAAVNGPNRVVVSGMASAVEHVSKLAAAAGRPAIALNVSHAFHSPLMEPILADLDRLTSSLQVHPPGIKTVSNVTGGDFGEIEPGYWSKQVREPVRFHQGMQTVVDSGCSLIVEIGPHPALGPSSAETFKIRCLSTLMRDHNDVSHILQTVAALFVGAVPIDWAHLFEASDRRRVPLPLYPFRRDYHWIRFDRGFTEPSEFAKEPVAKARADLHPLLGRVTSSRLDRFVFEASVAATQPWVDHRILGATVFPGTGFLEMAVRGFAALKDEEWKAVVLQDVVFERALVLTYGKPKTITLSLEPDRSAGSSQTAFSIAAAGRNGELFCRGRVAAGPDTEEKDSVERFLGRMVSKPDIATFYGDLRKYGFEYGSSFSTIRELWVGAHGSGEAMARVAASARPDGAADHPFSYTTTLDGCLQVFVAALGTLELRELAGSFVPHAIRRASLRNRPFKQLWGHATVRSSEDDRVLKASIRVLTETGDVIADIEDLELRPVAKMSLKKDGRRSEDRVTESRHQLVERLGKLPVEARVDALSGWLMAEVKDIFGQSFDEGDFERIDPSTALIEIGLDSLLMTELQRRIQEKLEFRFKAMQALDHQSPRSLAEHLLQDVLLFETNGMPSEQLAGV